MSEKEEYDHDCEVLLKTLCKFSLKELNDIVSSKFATLSWDHILKYMDDNRLPLNNKNVAYFLYRFLEDQTPANVFKVRLNLILLTEMLSHCNRRTWYCYEMRGHGVNKIMKAENLKKRVMQSCEESAITALCEVKHADNFYWIIIQEYRTVKVAKKKKGETRKRFRAPVYFAAAFKEPYLFTTSRSVSDDIMLTVASGLGYEACKMLRLFDKNVTEMLKALKLKERQCAANADFEIPSFVQGEPEVCKSGGVNFMGLDDRAHHIEQRFGEEPPKLTRITFKVREKVSECAFHELDNIAFPVQVTFKSENIWETIKSTLINTNAIDFPHPSYMEQAMLSGKSQILLVSKDSMDSTSN